MQIINEIKKITFKPSLNQANKMNETTNKRFEESVKNGEFKELKRSPKLIWFRKPCGDCFQERETGQFWTANIFF